MGGAVEIDSGAAETTGAAAIKQVLRPQLMGDGDVDVLFPNRRCRHQRTLHPIQVTTKARRAHGIEHDLHDMLTVGYPKLA
jgi:hypothetical protein